MMNGLDRMRGRIVGGSGDGDGANEAAGSREIYWRGRQSLAVASLIQVPSNR